MKKLILFIPARYIKSIKADGNKCEAQAVIEGSEVIVSSKKVSHPIAVRYGWRDISQPNLFNTDSLQASPFITDNWKRITEGSK